MRPARRGPQGVGGERGPAGKGGALDFAVISALGKGPITPAATASRLNDDGIRALQLLQDADVLVIGQLRATSSDHAKDRKLVLGIDVDGKTATSAAWSCPTPWPRTC